MNNGKNYDLGIDIFRFFGRIAFELHTSLIKSGGGNGPMKPGNLRIFGSERCQIRRQTRDEDSIDTHIESRCAVFYFRQTVDNGINLRCKPAGQTLCSAAEGRLCVVRKRKELLWKKDSLLLNV